MIQEISLSHMPGMLPCRRPQPFVEFKRTDTFERPLHVYLAQQSIDLARGFRIGMGKTRCKYDKRRSSEPDD